MKLILFLGLLISQLSFAQFVQVNNCTVGNIKVDGQLIGEIKISLAFEVKTKLGSGNLALIKPNRSTQNFPMQCKMMTEKSYLVEGRLNEHMICDTIQPVVKNLTYGVPIWVDEKGIPHVETYTVFNDGQGFSALLFHFCDSK